MESIDVVVVLLAICGLGGLLPASIACIGEPCDRKTVGSGMARVRRGALTSRIKLKR